MAKRSTARSSKKQPAVGRYPVTPDGRYFLVRGTLWRCTNPNLPTIERERLVKRLMTARRAVAAANRLTRAGAKTAALAKARRAVDRAKRALGEREAVWWTDGAPDFNQHEAANTPYAAWAKRFSPPPSGRGSG